MSNARRECVLVLGAGNSKIQRIMVPGIHLKSEKGTTFSENFDRVCTIDIDPGCKPDILWDLTEFPWPVDSDFCDEVHAYEVLEHLGELGDYESFFALWKEIWRVLKPGGLVFASTPWWQSVWAWQDPGHRRVYSRELLTYLSQAEYERQIGVTAMTDYRRAFPPPYSFHGVYAEMAGEDPLMAGFHFVLQKEAWDVG